jgi:flagellar hook-associated protein 3 FlgL
MRVAFSQTYEKMNININRQKEDVDRYAIMVSTGERMQKPADDPQSWAQAMDLRQGMHELDSIAKNVKFAANWNQATTSALSGVMQLVMNAKSAGYSSISAQTPEKRAELTQLLNEVIRETVSLANGQLGEQYLFGGSSYTTAPFGMTEVNGDVTTVTAFQGGPVYNLNVRTGKGSAETVNINGQVAFDTAGTDVLQQLLSLKNAVQAGDNATVQAQMTLLDNSFQNLMRLNALTGTRQDGLKRKDDMLSTLQGAQHDQLDDVAKADPATAIIHLQQSQTVYQAALQATSTLSKLNLAQFL